MMGHVRGNAGIGELWVIALPMVISSTFDVLVMFIGRMFLSRVDSLQMAAMMTGGLTCFTASTFFIGMISYSGAIIAHLYGAGRKKDCSRMLTQAVMLAMLADALRMKRRPAHPNVLATDRRRNLALFVLVAPPAVNASERKDDRIAVNRPALGVYPAVVVTADVTRNSAWY